MEGFGEIITLGETARTVQKIFRNAYKKTGIKKNVSVHSLGYKSSKITEIYISTKDLSTIKNSLDSLLEGGEHDLRNKK